MYVYIYIYIFITVFSLCSNCIECLGVGLAAHGSPIGLSDLTHAGQIIVVSDYIARLPLRWTQGHTYIDVYFCRLISIVSPRLIVGRMCLLSVYNNNCARHYPLYSIVVILPPILWGPIWGAGVGERVDPGGDCGGASLRISSVRPEDPTASVV
jgi:hypothetical protein